MEIKGREEEDMEPWNERKGMEGIEKVTATQLHNFLAV